MPRLAAALRRCAAVVLWVGATLLLACAAPAASPTGATVVDAAWRQEVAAPATALPPLPGAPPIANCAQLLAALRGGVDLAERIESPQFNAYANCVAAAVLDGAPVGNAPSRFDLERAGAQIVATLDLSTLPSSLAQQRPAPHYVLADFAFVRSRVAPLSVELTSSTFDYRFDVLAVGDFQRTGQRELLVRFAERAQAGSYDAVRMLVLTWPADQAAMTAVDALDLLRRRSKAP